MHLPELNDLRVHHRNPCCRQAEGRTILYWMQRSQRVLDNPALQTAVDLANLWNVPLVVGFCLDTAFPRGQQRHFDFMLRGLDATAVQLRERKIPLLLAANSPVIAVKRWIDDLDAAAVIADENPLRYAEQWRQQLAKELTVPFLTVDSDVIVPTRFLVKEEYAARTIRPKLHRVLEQFLELPPSSEPHYQAKLTAEIAEQSPSPPSQWADLSTVSTRAEALTTFPAGTQPAQERLRLFSRHGLHQYDKARNQPNQDGTSKLSPYLHFGQIGPHTIAWEIKNSDALPQAKTVFLEELIIRRELAINFVHYNSNYDNFRGIHPWAQQSLNQHRMDLREYTYSLDQLESAATHDPLWNAAQQQMVKTGWMHGYVRMYWAKKILEWTEHPEQAWEFAIDLNDTYLLDGRDPNGYTGIAWALGGKHDRAWGPERPIFGKVRYMSLASTGRKFDSKGYMERFADTTPS